jgi:DNA (cytosine-5)-methyltransferase 1
LAKAHKNRSGQLKEVDITRKNRKKTLKPVVVDLFAGAGGFSLGFQWAGFDTPFFLEIDKWACDTLRYNHPNGNVIEEDIRKFKTSQEINKVCTYTPDVLIGGPPCQGFSIAGPAQKDPKDPRNSLFQDFARWIEALEPRVLIMENVTGILSRRNDNGEYVIKIIEKTFQELGYRINIWTLNAAEYGVPQTRERVFIVGTQSDILLPPPNTHKLNNINGPNEQAMLPGLELPPAITLWEAISDLPPLKASEGEEEQPYTSLPQNDYQRWVRKDSETIYNHVAMHHSRRIVERFKHIGWGESSADVPKEYGPRERGNNNKLSSTTYDQNNRRLHPDRPSHTIAASFYANFVHPYQNRNLTAREGARAQSFPDSYRFLGKRTVPSRKLLKREGRLDELYLCQYNQIGNAVPPLLARNIAEHILKECL